MPQFSSLAHSLTLPLAGLSLVATLGLATLPARAADAWTVDPQKSTIVFEGTQAGATFRGAFETWSANIAFSPDDLDASGVTVTIETASAKTGDAQKDANLPTPNWFNAGAQPTAIFKTETIAQTDDGYLAKGTLTLRDVTKPVELPFTLTIDGSHAEMVAETTVNRTDYGIGAGIPIDMIADEVTIAVTVSATRGD